MNRKEFLHICSILGIGVSGAGVFSACNNSSIGNTNFTGKVLIIGAGAGGLSSGYLLNKQGIEFEILEASSMVGGRMKTNKDFTDFPIPLGAEWLHTRAGVLDDIVNDDTVPVTIETVGYTRKDTVAYWDNGELTLHGSNDPDLKFVNATWLTFYEEYIIPSVSDYISYNTVVESIDYSDTKVTVQTSNGSYTADKVIVAVPLKILQERDIAFTPSLPQDKLEAIDSITIWEGFKAFFEFSEAFYHTATSFNITPQTDGQKLYYDAAFGQHTDRHILGLFTVGKPALEYGSLSEDDFIDTVLSELDEIYNNRATQSYIKHITQNWNNEPFIKAGYISDHANWRTVRKLRTPVDNKIYFAGGPFTNGEDWVAVHAAAQSAKDAVKNVLG